MEVLILGIWVICGVAGATIATQKGRNAGRWAVLCLLFGPFGVMLALVARQDEATLAAQAIASGDSRRCPQCAELVKAAAVKCRYCGSPLAPRPKPAPAPIAGTCFLCGVAFREPVDTCPKCGRKDPLARPGEVARCIIALAGMYVFFVATPASALTDAEILDKYLVPAYQTPQEPRHCRGMTKELQGYADMLHEAEVLRDKVHRDRYRVSQQAPHLFTETQANVQSVKQNLHHIQGYIQRHCHTWEQTPYAVELCKWSIPALCDFSHKGMTEQEVCDKVLSLKAQQFRVLDSVDLLAALRSLSYPERQGRQKTLVQMQEVDRFLQERLCHLP